MTSRAAGTLLFPGEMGYRMPAEWHPHTATLLLWPSNQQTWPGNRLHKAEQVFLNVLEALHRYEPVVLLAEPGAMRHAGKRLAERGLDRQQILLLEAPINDLWARDCGPIFVHRVAGGEDQYLITDWEYNAWGGKYPPWEDDNRIPGFISRTFSVQAVQTGSVLEGGAIETNGEGTFLVTESVLLNPNRRPAGGKREVEGVLRRWLGAERVIWLGDGLAGDDTDGHIDDLCRFLDPRTIMTVVSTDRKSPNYETLRRNLDRLKAAEGPDGVPLRIEVLPLPETAVNERTVDGSKHVPASYANFYIGNGVVLMPLYDERFDRQAIELLARYFPDRDVVGIACADLVWGQGGIHCITQQLYGFPFYNSYSL